MARQGGRGGERQQKGKRDLKVGVSWLALPVPHGDGQMEEHQDGQRGEGRESGREEGIR